MDAALTQIVLHIANEPNNPDVILPKFLQMRFGFLMN